MMPQLRLQIYPRPYVTWHTTSWPTSCLFHAFSPCTTGTRANFHQNQFICF